MKKFISILMCIFIVAAFGLFAIASSDDAAESGQDSAAADTKLGDYEVEITSCRLAVDYEGKAVVIVKYKFTNNADEPASFTFTFDDHVYQDGVGLNESFFLNDNYGYSSDNQTKEIKKGSTLDVEVAYVLNDTTTDIEVEVAELISFEDTKVTKTFSIK